MNTLNKQKIVEILSEKTQKSPSEVNGFLFAFTDLIFKTVKSGERINIVGFGQFYFRRRKGRKGINPRTFESMEIEPVNVVKFVPSRKFKNMIK